jgi:hypothetical protein
MFWLLGNKGDKRGNGHASKRQMLDYERLKKLAGRFGKNWIYEPAVV